MGLYQIELAVSTEDARVDNEIGQPYRNLAFGKRGYLLYDSVYN